MSAINALSSQQLRRAAALKDRIQKLQKELGKILGGQEAPSPAKRGKKRRKMSAAARAKIAAAQKARWAKAKAK